MLTLNEAKHKYTLDTGEVLSSVTQIIEPYKGCNTPDQWYADRGTAIHKACELHLKGTLDINTVDSSIAPYYQAFLNFLNDKPAINGVLDIKSGTPAPWHELQIAAYYELWLHGTAANGAPMYYISNAQEISAWHPLYQYAGTIDIISVEGSRTQSVGMYLLYLTDTGRYNLAVVKDKSKKVREFLTLASAHHIRQRYAI